jgi:DNA repair exonuclease SbcCD nuclease subunit
LCWDKPVGRLDDIVETGLQKMNFVYKYAYDNKIDAVLIAGDLFDVKRSWNLLNIYTEFFNKWKGIKTYAVQGQHDSYYHSLSDKATVFGVLESANLIHRLTKTPVDCGSRYTSYVWVYGASYGEEIPIPKAVPKEVRGMNILVIHAPILMKKVWKQQTDYKYAPEALYELNYDLILCGDMHQKFLWKEKGKIICNTGPLLRLESSEAMLSHKPGFYQYDPSSREIQWVPIPCQDGNKVLSRTHIETKEHRDELLSKFVDSISGEEGFQAVSFDKNLKRYITKNKVSEGVRKILSETYPG